MGVLDKLTIAVVGTHPHDAKQMRTWIERNGGRYSAKITKSVTHLIASKEAYEQLAHAVQQATDLGIYVVSYDWFDDSLQGKKKLSAKKYTWEVLVKERRKKKQLKRLGTPADGSKFRKGCEKIEELTGSGTSKKSPAVTRKPRKSKSFFFSTSTLAVSPTPFVSAKEDLLRRRAERETALADDAVVRERQGSVPIIDLTDDSTNPVNRCPSSSASKAVSPTKPVPKNLKSTRSSSKKVPQAKISHWKEDYHYYQDVTGFEYKIVLVRGGESPIGMANYHIGLLESHTKPHVYWALVQYKPPKALPPRANDDGAQQHPEAARLLSLITKPVPVPELPYNGELCPRASDFATASRSFRHAFRDLTLLSWEERFDADKTLQKARAQHLNMEPFWYGKPKMGMPMGLLPQEMGMLTGETTSLEVRGDIEDNYVRGTSNLPSISAPLGKNGIIGGPIHRDAQDVRKREEARLQKIKDKEEAEKRSKGQMQARGMGVNHNRPMFNGPMGRPTIDAYGQHISYGGNGEYTKYSVSMPVGGGGGVGGNKGFVAPEFAHLLGGRRKYNSRPFPDERNG
ncbi:hypothetical protein G6011_04243 [Alternaria panax]|uniref:BRCT domain-containing protein n=1 Tax=Alternaria panax TaxID=48097 RepID=A0AAD4IG63_9PLEO|nr:hypothetical protein G6011_04243 [Alternaria panax]